MVETTASAEAVPAQDAKAWLDAIQQAEKDMAHWSERAKKIEKIWLEERSEAKRLDRQYALLWANTAVLQPAVYARQPQPVVTRRFADRDPVARNLSEVMERTLVTIFDHANIDDCLKSVRDNFLVVARGTAWVRYVPTITTQRMEIEGEPQEIEVLSDETLAFDFVHWSDFLHPKARRWEDLPWVGRRVYLDKQSLTKRFGAEKADAVAAAHFARNPGEMAKAKPANKPCVYEIWSKRDQQVYWLAKDYSADFLDRKPPLYDLHGFFPCPKPAYGTLPTDKLEPVPDYVFYQDQAEEINELTAKIGALEDALKLVGFYPAGAEGGISSAIEKALSPGTGNEMIPVPSWEAFVQGGGSKQMIEWLPVEQVIAVLQGCVQLRSQLIQDVFQITGISDIIRGSSDPRETMGAQQIKAQWGSIRIRDRQAEMARFCRDMTRIGAEIVAEKFQPETLWRASGLNFPTNGQKQQAIIQIRMMQEMIARQAQQAQQTGQPAPQMPPLPEQIKDIIEKPSQEQLVQLMRDDQMRSYRVDIETDSTVIADEQAEKEARTEFVTMLGGFLQQAIPAITQVPEMAPLIGQSLLFATRAFRAGRQLEDTIEQFVQMIDKKSQAMANRPPMPDPKMEKIKADLALGEKKIALEAQKMALDHQQDQTDTQAGMAQFAAENEREWANVLGNLALGREKIAATNADALREPLIPWGEQNG